MINRKNIILALFILCFVTVYAFPEVVILKDGSKYIGKVTDEGDKLKISTTDGELTVSKDRVKTIYKDAETIIGELDDILAGVREIISGANKITDGKERNASLNKALESLMYGQKICFDIVGVFSGKDADTINNRYQAINAAMKDARSLMVMENNLPPPKAENQPTDSAPTGIDKTPPSEPITPTVTAGRENKEAALECYTLGISASNNKEYDKARELFIKAVSYDPELAEAYARLGDAYGLAKEDDMEFSNYRKFLELIAGRDSLSLEQIKLRDETVRKYDKFKIITDKLDPIAKDCLNKLMELGLQAMAEKDDYLAQDIFSLALLIKEEDEEIWGYLKQVNDKLALESDKTPAEENADLADVYYKSGMDLFNQNKYNEALEKFAKALSYKEYMPGALLKSGECLEKNRNFKDAIKNYRLCLIRLETIKDLTEEDKNILSQATANLKKIDAIGNDAGKIKDKYVNGLIAAANDCNNKKFIKLATAFYEKALRIDRNNKAANDALAKIKGDKPADPKTGASAGGKPIFNNRDLTDWWVPDFMPSLWTVEKTSLVFNSGKSKESSTIIYRAITNPAAYNNYTVYAEMYIEKRVQAPHNEIAFLYGGLWLDLFAKNKQPQSRIRITNEQPGSWVKFKFTKRETKFTLEENGKLMKSGELKRVDNQTIGIFAQGFILKFKTITLEQN